MNRVRHCSRKPVEGQTITTNGKLTPMASSSSSSVVPAGDVSNSLGLSNHHQLSNLLRLVLTIICLEYPVLTVRYTAMSEDGTVFEKKGFDGEQPLQFITDEEQVIAGLDRAVSTMKKNERAIITISPEYGFGSTEVKMGLSLVQPSSTILYEVEMLDFIRVISITLLDVESFGDNAQYKI